ncbi:hypothetical protein VQZ80_003472 [Salmonella enterica]|nr:hypothetical protein [Salmonella enterica]EEI9212331.1 hypothetical protein [Salmonella enterica subsp. enterica serovar Carrau]EEJ7412433.1 hypothetical protein [Salmonella enterica subsp. enterica serovar Sandiego]HCM4646361.1 hypothetical protein [Salmonella enterica subsp. enterica serovar Panama]EDI6983370.1 hypothetical protein [Salmonella enterica]
MDTKNTSPANKNPQTGGNMKRINAILMVLFFGLLISTFSPPALAFLCSMIPDRTTQECAKICSGGMGLFNFLFCL